MPIARALRIATWLHTWSSLVCTAFMLLLCLTGLPLIFSHEISHALGNEVEAPEVAHSGPRASLDALLREARTRYPERIVQFASQPDDDDRMWFVTLTPTPAPTEDFRSIGVDARTARFVGEPPVGQGFMTVMLRLHVDLFAGLPGKLFLGAMGLLLLVAIVTGVMLYSPFMRRLAFGDVRRDRSPRIRWLDLHNLTGIVTLTWVFVVGATGMINTWAELVLGYWRNDQLVTLVAPYRGEPMIAEGDRGSVQTAMENALRAVPGRRVAFIAFPGTLFSSPHHYTFFLRGDTPLTAKLLAPVLVDAKTSAVTAAPGLPWYLSALLVSQPLHFGDYGGMPMKVIWALLDVATIVVLGSGLYLWFKRRQRRAEAAAGFAGRR